MTHRERYLATLKFRNSDRVPLIPGYERESTKFRWYKEGLVEGEDTLECAYHQAGGQLDLLTPQFADFPVNERMIPQFKEKVISQDNRNQIVQDWKGNICEISNEFTVEHLQNPIDFVTRRWIKCPVESVDDWEDIKQRYNSEDAKRFDIHVKDLAIKLQYRTQPIELNFSGPFWQLREWCGFENLCMMFYDNPILVQDMIKFWQEHILVLLQKAFTYIIPDMVHLSEDMAYKCFSMISPTMVRKFLLPTYKRWGEFLLNAGCPIYGMDSDGYIGELIPIWIEAGINQCDPIEVAAGNDIVEFQKKFGKNMAYRGGIDKRCIAEGGSSIENEINRIKPVIKNGGYIPGCDHGIPNNVSWPNFVNYVKLLARETGWI